MHFRSVVTETCFFLQDIIIRLGPIALQEGVAPELGQAMQQLITKQAPCQTNDLDEQDDGEGTTLDEEEEAEIDALLIDAVADVIAAMATVMQANFVPYFAAFYPHIIKYFVSTSFLFESFPRTVAQMGWGKLFPL